jgi:hypothetical protein
VDFDGGVEEWPKKAEALDVIHVEVGEEEVYAADGSHELFAEAADAGAGVEDEDGSFTAAYFDAGGIAAVAFGFWAGGG